ncbi:hypothetical protein [Spirillospora sp. CA-294931]|uniref:hypothetical protein n=1 Tax=Spirillospora sp. CA-294931 TaxID=3240042 RepID=UPI003D8D7BBF
MTTESATSVVRDVLRVYDGRFLELDPARRERLVEGTRRLIGEDGLDEEIRAALPAAFRLRAFCIQHGLRDELERLIRDEVDGAPAGAVVVGGRVYAMHPYLRGVPRQDADITGEVGVEHRLDAVSWQSKRVRIRGRAAIERIQARLTEIEVILRERESRVEHRFAAETEGDAFEAWADLTVPGPGRWDVHVAAQALGVRREARFGTVRSAKVGDEPQRRTLDGGDEASIYFTRGGHLAVLVEHGPCPAPLRTKIRRRLTR